MAKLHCYESSKQCKYVQGLYTLEDGYKTQRRKHKFPGFALVKGLDYKVRGAGTGIAEGAPDKIGVWNCACQPPQ